jgi:hypothetical protein
MHSTDYPVEGCHCCSQYSPVPDKETEDNGNKNYNIYQTCVDDEDAKAGEDGGMYQ